MAACPAVELCTNIIIVSIQLVKQTPTRREHLGHLMNICTDNFSFWGSEIDTVETCTPFARSNNLPVLQIGHFTKLPWLQTSRSNCSINNIRIPPSGSCCIFYNSSGCNHKVIAISYLAHHARLPDHLNRIQPTDGVLSGSKEALQAALTKA